MKLSKGLLFAGLAAVCGVVWLGSYGCDQRTVAPEPEQPVVELVDYPVYFINQLAAEAISYRVVSGKIDTIQLPFIAFSGMEVSPDGDQLYVAGEAEVAKVDLATGEVEVIWPEGPSLGITLSPDGRYLALHGAELNILELSTQTVIHRETERVFRGVFSAGSHKYYAPTAQCQILQVGLEGSGAVSRTSFPGRCYGRMAVSADQNNWYLYDLGPCYGWLDVYDRNVDSLVFSTYFRPGFGNLVLTPSETHVLYTSPGPIEDFCWPHDGDYTIGVYDVASNKLSNELSTRDLTTTENMVDSTLIIEMVVTPDSRWLVGLSFRGDLVRVDLERMELVSFQSFDRPQPIAQFPRCQTGL